MANITSSTEFLVIVSLILFKLPKQATFSGNAFGVPLTFIYPIILYPVDLFWLLISLYTSKAFSPLPMRSVLKPDHYERTDRPTDRLKTDSDHISSPSTLG